MNKWKKTSARILAVGMTLGLLSGCAVTQEDFDALKAEVSQLSGQTTAASAQAEEARFLAEKAMDEARRANSCCAANTERMERMFKKSMMK